MLQTRWDMIANFSLSLLQYFAVTSLFYLVVCRLFLYVCNAGPLFPYFAAFLFFSFNDKTVFYF